MKTVSQIGAGEIELTDASELNGFRVGQKLTPPDVGARSEIRYAKDLTVVGFTEFGQVVIRIDGDKCFCMYPRKINIERDRSVAGAWQYGCVGFGGS